MQRAICTRLSDGAIHEALHADHFTSAATIVEKQPHRPVLTLQTPSDPVCGATCGVEAQF